MLLSNLLCTLPLYRRQLCRDYDIVCRQSKAHAGGLLASITIFMCGAGKELWRVKLKFYLLPQSDIDYGDKDVKP